MSEIISSYGSKASQRRRKLNEAMESFYKEKDQKVQDNLQSLNESTAIDIENRAIALKDTSNRIKSRKSYLKESVETITSIKENLIKDSFAYIVYEALPLDKEFKEHNMKYINESASEVFNTLSKENLISIDENSIFGGICSNINTEVDNASGIDETQMALNIKEHCKFEFETCVNVLSEKLIDVIKVERKMTENKELVESQGRIIRENEATKTLFKKLFEKNITSVVEDKKEEGLDKKDIMSLAFSESILDYALLEGLYTLKCIEIDSHRLNSVIKFI